MQLVLHNGDIKEVDTKCIFDNQYNTTDGKRIYDVDVKYIIDDIRLGEFYCSSVKQGTYEEVLNAIREERSKINQCKGCNYWRATQRVEEKCTEEKIVTDTEVTTIRTTVHKFQCTYYKSTCVHDIEEKPVLFREKKDCFFCKYPNGAPDMTSFKKFLVNNADKYNIVARWSNQELTETSSFKCSKKFGSYLLESIWYNDYFTLSNARNEFRFYIDFKNKKFILRDSIGYRLVDDFRESSHKSNLIKNYDKFETWIMQAIDDYLVDKGSD